MGKPSVFTDHLSCAMCQYFVPVYRWTKSHCTYVPQIYVSVHPLMGIWVVSTFWPVKKKKKKKRENHSTLYHLLPGCLLLLSFFPHMSLLASSHMLYGTNMCLSQAGSLDRFTEQFPSDPVQSLSLYPKISILVFILSFSHLFKLTVSLAYARWKEVWTCHWSNESVSIACTGDLRGGILEWAWAMTEQRCWLPVPVEGSSSAWSWASCRYVPSLRGFHQVFGL